LTQLRRGLAIGGLLAFAIAAASVYDEYARYRFLADEFGLDSTWLPDPLVTLGPVVVALVAFATIARAAVKGRNLWPLAVVFSVIAVGVTAVQTFDIYHQPGDPTFSMYVVPALVAAALVAALALGRK
jgi:hypothetical protein